MLKFTSSEFKLAGSNIKRLSLQAFPWGFNGEVEFIVINYPIKDSLYADFIKAGELQVELTVARGLQPPKNTKVTPMTVTGVVTDRSYRETPGDLVGNTPVAGNPILFRTYCIKFTDPAEYFWGKHYPTRYYSDTDMSTIIQDNLVNGIQLKMDWDVLKVKQPNVTVKTGFGEPGCVSFYDFILWYIDQNGGFFVYQYAESSYLIAGQRPDTGSADDIPCNYLDLENLEIGLPPIQSSKLQIINGVAIAPSIEKSDKKGDILPLSRDVLVREDIPKEFQAYVKSQKSKELEHISAESRLDFKSILYQMFYPEDVLTCNQATWSKQSYLYGKKIRVFSIAVSAKLFEDNVTDNIDSDEAVYDMGFHCILHDVEDDKKRLPVYRTPSYPVLMEGVVRSDVSEKNSSTYNIIKDQETLGDYLQVEIPVWEKILARVQHDPGHFTGQFYFPPYNGQKVLLGLWFHGARILRNLDWRACAPLPVESQGNHLVFGTKSDSRSSIQHSYIDNQPKLDISRVLENDVETISLAEGSIILRTRQDKS